MYKRKILFVVNHLTIGGVQKSLISALNAIDYEKNDVTLYLRKNRTTLLPYVNNNVTVIINEDSNHYYRSLTAIFLQFMIKIGKLFGKDCSSLSGQLRRYVTDRRMEYEKNTYLFSKSYSN